MGGGEGTRQDVGHEGGLWCEKFNDSFCFNKGGGRVVFEVLWKAIQRSAKVTGVFAGDPVVLSALT